MHRFQWQCLRLKPLNTRLQTRMTSARRQKRAKFAKTLIRWSIRDSKRVRFTGGSLYELSHHPNHQKDRASVGNSTEVPIAENVTQPVKLAIWGMVTFLGFPDILKVPSDQILTSGFYVKEVSEGTAVSATTQQKENRPQTAVQLLTHMSQVIFQHHGAPAHDAFKTHQGYQAHFPGSRVKGGWPCNSSHLPPLKISGRSRVAKRRRRQQQCQKSPSSGTSGLAGAASQLIAGPPGVLGG